MSGNRTIKHTMTPYERITDLIGKYQKQKDEAQQEYLDASNRSAERQMDYYANMNMWCGIILKDLENLRDKIL